MHICDRCPRKMMVEAAGTFRSGVYVERMTSGGRETEIWVEVDRELHFCDRCLLEVGGTS